MFSIYGIINTRSTASGIYWDLSELQGDLIIVHPSFTASSFLYCNQQHSKAGQVQARLINVPSDKGNSKITSNSHITRSSYYSWSEREVYSKKFGSSANTCICNACSITSPYLASIVSLLVGVAESKGLTPTTPTMWQFSCRLYVTVRPDQFNLLVPESSGVCILALRDKN